MNLIDAIELAKKQDNEKKPYTFRCNVKRLEQLKQYATINDVKLPQLMNIIIDSWCSQYVEGNITDIEYISADIIDRVSYIESDIDKYQKELNRLSNQLNSIKDECNRELIKK